MFKKSFKLFLLTVLLTSCAVKVPKQEKGSTLKLTHLLLSLDSKISIGEATQLSKEIFAQTALLSTQFHMTSPPQYHNFLVNVGLREKGLCYHWSDALYRHFIQKEYPSFAFHLMGANIGEYWDEHNTLVVSAKDKEPKKGVVIDPWRNAGKLYFSKVVDDTAYRWIHRPTRGCKNK